MYTIQRLIIRIGFASMTKLSNNFPLIKRMRNSKGNSGRNIHPTYCSIKNKDSEIDVIYTFFPKNLSQYEFELLLSIMSENKKDNYQIISLIGQGAYGQVYKGRRKYTGQFVAIKSIKKKGK